MLYICQGPPYLIVCAEPDNNKLRNKLLQQWKLYALTRRTGCLVRCTGIHNKSAKTYFITAPMSGKSRDRWKGPKHCDMDQYQSVQGVFFHWASPKMLEYPNWASQNKYVMTLVNVILQKIYYVINVSNWPTRLPSISGQAASCLQLAAVTEPP